ncbi:MAG: DUF5067 domain-containing protein [Ruoffia tabacinasalis]|uniref:DUF5067 domain-containing protein n=1 Tax=Lactobacillales TaxID=186826 RepID=UPI0038892433
MRRRNERTKKKMGCLSWIGLLALVFVGLGLAGVFDDDDTESANVVESSQVTASDDVSEATEPEPVEVDDNIIEVGKALSLADVTFTITDLSIADDYEGNQALVITYDWENNSEDSKSPYLTFSAKGFQDGVETDSAIFVDGVDLGKGQKEVKSGGKISGAHTTVGIEDMSKPLLLEIDELITFNKDPYYMEIDLNEL